MSVPEVTEEIFEPKSSSVDVADMKSSKIRSGALVLALGGLVPAAGCFSATSMETSDTEDGDSTGVDDPSAGSSATSSAGSTTTADPSTSSTSGMQPEDDDGAETSGSEDESSSGFETSSTTDDSETSSEESSTSDGDIAPLVSETIPADGDAGVLADAAIEIQFSEPMDQAATQAAYQSMDIPTALVTFSWNDAGDRMTVTPTFSLLYALANEVEEPAYAYSFTITTTAESEAGIGLEEDLEVEFTTLRRFVQVFDYDNPLSGSVRDLAGPINAPNLGDTATNDPSRYFVTFDISERAPDIVEVQNALLLVERSNNVTGSPFTELGAVVYQPVHYDVLNDATFDTEGLSSAYAVFPTIADPAETVDVGDDFEDLLADPDAYNDLLQFRLFWFPNESNGDNDYDSILINEGTNPPQLSLQYLAP